MRHILLGEYKVVLPSAICKFVYFDEKSVIRNSWRILRKKINFVNKKGIC